MPKSLGTSMEHQVLSCLRKGPAVAGELPVPHASIHSIVAHLNKDMRESGWHITSRRVVASGKFMPYRTVQYSLTKGGQG